MMKANLHNELSAMWFFIELYADAAIAY